MIKISFEAANPAALTALIDAYLHATDSNLPKPAAADVKPPKAEKPAAAPAAEAKPATTPTTAPVTAVTYDMIAAQVPKTSALGDNAKTKMKELMAKWGVNPGAGKKVKDVVPAEKYGEFFAELSAIDNG